MTAISKVLKGAMPQEIWFVVPMTPVGFNHYVRHTRTGRHYVSKEAKVFKEFVWVHCGRRQMRARAYQVEATVYLDKKQKGDADGFWKLILDGLVYAGVIDTDAKVSDIILRKRRDPGAARTEIRVTASKS